VSPVLRPGPPATQHDLQAAQELEELRRTELSRVRAAAIAWRNGLAGLLAALAGFGIVKGRSDVSDLAASWAHAVGVLLLAALLVGAAGALSLIRASTGLPRLVDAQNLRSRGHADHIEAIASAKALRRGIGFTLTCAALLVTAVGATWYGPGRLPATLRISTPSGTVCGTVVRLDNGTLTINTADGPVVLPPGQSITVRPTSTCPPP
jgi:hypothetical protein